MSEFEMASLHVELFNSVQSSVTVFLTVLSAFLVTSYFAAHRLRPAMAAIGVIAYAGFEVANLMGTSATLRSYAGLTREMQAYAASGRGLAWHNTSDALLWIVGALQPGMLVLGVVVLGASIYFFFHYRRANRLAQARA